MKTNEAEVRKNKRKVNETKISAYRKLETLRSIILHVKADDLKEVWHMLA